MYGYRVMTLDDDNKLVARDGSDMPLEVGSIHSTPGEGIFLSLDPDYVLDYYSHGSDDPEDPQQALMKYEFSPEDIMFGNLTDRETEFTVPKAKLINYSLLHEREAVVEEADRNQLNHGVQQEGL